MKKSKLLVSAMIACMCVSILSGCGSKKADTAKTKEKGPVKLQFTLSSDSGETVELYKKMIAQYESLNKNVKIEFKPIIQDYDQKVLVMVGGGNAPDVMWASDSIVANYAKNNGLVDLTPYDGKYFKSKDFDEQVLSSYKVKDKIYALPSDTSTMALFINRDLFKKYNVEIPNESMSWEQLREIAKKLTVKEENQYGFALEYGTGIASGVFPFLMQNKAKLISDDGQKSTFNTPEVIETFNFLRDMMVTDKSSPSATGENKIGPSELFKAGKLAMLWGGTWNLSTTLPDVKFNYDIVKLPHKQQQASIAYSGGFAVTQSTKNADEAVKFMAWFAGEEGQKIRCESSYAGAPTVTKLLSSATAFKGFENPNRKDVNTKLLAEIHKNLYALPIEIGTNKEFIDSIKKYTDLFMEGKLDADAATKEIDKSYESINK